jgi:hypothetical protein
MTHTMLTEISHSHIRKGHYYSLFKCSCGGEKVLEKGNVAAGKIVSCGCFKRQKMRAEKLTHGLTRTPAYRSWAQMKTRCENPNYKEFYYYGGRGIKICERWNSFENFLADMGSRPEGKTLDRINGNGNYEPGNCRWATPLEQSRNRRKS